MSSHRPPLDRHRRHHAPPEYADHPIASGPIPPFTQRPLRLQDIERLHIETCPLHVTSCGLCGARIYAGHAWWRTIPATHNPPWFCWECGYAVALAIGIYTASDPPPSPYAPGHPKPGS